MALSVSSCVRRPVLDLPYLLSSFSTPVGCRRNQSSYRRTKRRLRVKPDESFITPSSETQDHIIFNPPSSAPSVYQTPTKFLPPNDARRRLRTDPQREPPKDNSNSNSINNQLPAVFKPIKEEKQILSAEQIEEIRKLRQEDPMTWSRSKLAKRFGCNPVFIGTICQATPEKRAMQAQVLEAVKSRWGRKRSMARENRELQRERWAKDQ